MPESGWKVKIGAEDDRARIRHAKILIVKRVLL